MVMGNDRMIALLFGKGEAAICESICHGVRARRGVKVGGYSCRCGSSSCKLEWLTYPRQRGIKGRQSESQGKRDGMEDHRHDGMEAERNKEPLQMHDVQWPP